MSTASNALLTSGVNAGNRSFTSSLPVLRTVTAMARSIPLEQWVTLGLLTVMFVAVAWAIQLSGWGDLPSLIPTMLMAGAAGFWASRTRVPWYLAHPVALVFGFAVVMWQGSIPAEGSSVITRAVDAWDRMFEWVNIARNGGISTDSVPFAMMMIASSWIIAYLVSWVTFKLRNPWLPVVFLGVALLTDLSYRQGRHEQTFFIYILAAVALFVHLTTVRRMDRWTAAGVPFPQNLRWFSVRDGLILGAVVVLVSVAIPTFEIKNRSLNEQWRILRRPIENLREPASRLLSGVRGKDARPPLTAPSEVLAFQGPISLTDDPVMWITSRYATLHSARVYDQYASSGWLVGPRTTNAVPASTPSGVLPPEKARQRIDQRIQPLFDTTTVTPVGGVASIDRDVTVEVLEPTRYFIPLTGAVSGLSAMPEDIRRLASTVRQNYFLVAASATTMVERVSATERSLARETPEGLESTLLVNPDTGAPMSLVIERPGPIEQVSVKLDDDVSAHDTYTVTTYVSLAGDEDLQAAGVDYPTWVTDRYVKLPLTLPRRVIVLANEIVARAEAETPYEKALAVAAFLRQQVYSQEIAGPLPNSDGVDYFLFDTRTEVCPTTLPDCAAGNIKGYSQYYGSAATVLLRAVGVPSRMVAGWAPGEYVESEGSFIIRDRDRHGWSQVYFPGYGWIDIEVTPGRDIGARGEEVSTSPAPDLSQLIGGQSFDEDLLLAQDIAETEAAQRAALEALAAAGNTGDSGFRVPPGVYYGLAAFGLVIVASAAAWSAAHAGMSPSTRSYTKMVRAGWVLGHRRAKGETARQYASRIGGVVPRAAPQAQALADVYERWAYAHREPSDSERSELAKAWRRVFAGLVSYRLGHLFSRPGAFRADRK